jgi:beta-lactam-binding protein with PASTA domain
VSPTPPKLVSVPGVVGERRSAAESTLRRAGFAVSVRLVPAPSARDIRRVIGQLPLAGQQARPGSVVVLLVGDR